MKSINLDNHNLTGHFVYKYIFNGDVIYVGKTDNSLLNRLDRHGKKGDNIPESAWDEINSSVIYFCKLQTSRQCDIYETELIRKYKPKYNRVKIMDWDGVDLPEPTWTLFEKSSKFLEKEYNNLEHKYRLLQGKYAILETNLKEKSSALEEYFRLQTDYSILADQYALLNKEYNNLKHTDNQSEQLQQYKDANRILQSKYNEVLKELFVLRNGGNRYE